MKVLNFGSLNLDYVYTVDHFVQPGETLAASRRSVKPGGKGLNQSVALVRAGARVSHAGCVGEGGESLERLLRDNGADISCLLHVPEMQGHTVIQVNAAGENCILLYGGSNLCITEKQVTDTLDRFERGDLLLLQNEINLLPFIVEEAFKRGLTVVLNPSPCTDALKRVDMDKLSWLLVNEIEAEQLTGESDPERAWDVLHARHPRLAVLITLGKRGSMCFRPGERGTERAVREAVRVRTVDTTAAGDTFTGYFIAGLLSGLPLEECMDRASRAAAISVTRPGAAESIPEKWELDGD